MTGDSVGAEGLKVDDRLTYARAAALANVSPGTVRNWVKRGHLPAVRVVSKSYVERADLERLLRGVPVPTAEQVK